MVRARLTTYKLHSDCPRWLLPEETECVIVMLLSSVEGVGVWSMASFRGVRCRLLLALMGVMLTTCDVLVLF